LAQAMVLRLQVIGLDATLVSVDAVWAALALSKLQAEDVVVGFGFSGYAADVASVMRFAKERGATTIGISGSDVSPVARTADIVLICVAASALHIPAEAAGSTIVEGLWEALTVDRMDVVNKNMRATSDVYEELTRGRLDPVGSVEESIMKLY
jgi:RpiR family transcriptional regulator, carbohydrate utilization regulator